MSSYVVLKRPGEPSSIIEAPEFLDIVYVQTKVGGYVQVFPPGGHLSEVLREVTLVIDEDGRRKDLPDNVEFPLQIVVGPILACITDDAEDDRGMPLEQAEAVAKVLDHYAVGMQQKAN